MKSITDKILNLASASGIEMIIIDLANVDVIDSTVAAHLVRLGDILTAEVISATAMLADIIAGSLPAVGGIGRLMMIEFTNEREVAEARDRASEMASGIGFDRMECAQVALAVSEIAGNAYKFAGRGTVDTQRGLHELH